MQISAEFVTSAAGAGDFPRDRLVELAMVGRSNVGKSSLINALARQKVARTSAAPGKTRLANFYRVQRGTGPKTYLVDLPGYGYARGGDASAVEFRRLTEAYFARAHSGSGIRDSGFEQRVQSPEPRIQEGLGLRIGVLLLVDSRHPGLQSDLEAWRWLQQQPCPCGVIGTKVDKLTRAERARHSRELESCFDIPVPLVSAETGEGLEELWKLIVTLPNQTAA
ncbi:MAG: YihA family ribosome biogenesis GTP-binding protein [Acidobacteria bacterium]|nr:YihA family ribosome biogenesis GTP-binding protein [Acidobacteriota bacterium]